MATRDATKILIMTVFEPPQRFPAQILIAMIQEKRSLLRASTAMILFLPSILMQQRYVITMIMIVTLLSMKMTAV